MDARLSDAVFAAPAAPTLGGPGPLAPVPAAPKPRTARVRVTSEVVGVRGALGGYYRSLPPFIDDLTREYGPDLYDRMQLDDQVSSSLRALCHGVLSDELVLRPGVDDKDDPDFAAAKDALGFCERATWQQTGGLDRWLLTMLKGAVGGGNRVSETVYRPEESGKDAGRWVLDRLKVKPRRSIAFAVDSCNNLSGFLGLAPDGPGWGALAWGTAFDPADPPDNFIPRDKFCALAWDPPDEDPRGSALLRCVYEPWWAKLQAARDWLAYLAQFGSPSLVGTTAPGADSSAPTDAYGNPTPGDVLTPEQDMANRVLEFRNGGVFILPSGATLEILQTSNAGDAFLKKVDSSDRAIAQGILLAMRAVMQSRFGSRADAEQGQDVAGLQTRFMKRWLARMVTEDLLRPLVRVNYGPDAARRLCPYASLSPVEHQDLGPALVAMTGAWKAGFLKNSQLPWAHEQFGMPPATPEELAAPPPAQPVAGQGPGPGAPPAPGNGQPPAPPAAAPFAFNPDEPRVPAGSPEGGQWGSGGGGRRKYRSGKAKPDPRFKQLPPQGAAPAGPAPPPGLRPPALGDAVRQALERWQEEESTDMPLHVLLARVGEKVPGVTADGLKAWLLPRVKDRTVKLEYTSRPRYEVTGKIHFTGAELGFDRDDSRYDRVYDAVKVGRSRDRQDFSGLARFAWNPDQPRVPAGSPGGGEWGSGGTGGLAPVPAAKLARYLRTALAYVAENGPAPASELAGHLTDAHRLGPAKARAVVNYLAADGSLARSADEYGRAVLGKPGARTSAPGPAPQATAAAASPEAHVLDFAARAGQHPGGLAPVWELRRQLGLPPDEFKALLFRLRREGKIRLVAVGDQSRLTHGQLRDSIQGENERLAYVEPGPNHPGRAAPFAVVGPDLSGLGDLLNLSRQEVLDALFDAALDSFDLALPDAAFGSPDQPRVPAGQPGGGEWASGGGADVGETTARWEKEDRERERRQEKESEGLEERQQEEWSALSEARDREDAVTEKRRDKEDSVIERQRDREEAREEAKSERAAQRAKDREDAASFAREKATPTHREWVRLDREYGPGSKESQEAWQRHEDATGRPAEDARLQKVHGQIDRNAEEYMDEWRAGREKVHAQEDAARKQARAAEDAATAARRDAEDEPVRARHEREMQDLAERHEAEDAEVYNRRRADHPAAYAAHYDTGDAPFYSPDQPRVPAGSPGGGRWAGGVSPGTSAARDAASDAVRAFAGGQGPPTAAEAEALAGHLARLTVAQIHALKAEHGLKGSAPNKAALVAKLAERFRAARAAEYGLPEAPRPGKVYNAAPSELHVDPSRFQYKLGTDPSGVTAELKSVRAWNPDFAGVVSVWKDPADGKTYVVNGHHRHELATRLGAPVLAVRYVNARTATEARAVGALVNIAEGRGTAVDAAKFMRDSGVGIGDMERHGVSVRGKVAEDAVALARLSDRAFGKLTLGTLDQGKALAVAKHLPDHALQDQLFGLLDKREDEGKDLSLRTIEEMAREMAATPTHTKKEASLFGDIESEESLFVPRNELKGHVRAELSREVNDFLAVASERRAGRVAGAGNVLDVERNRQIAEQAARVRNVFDTLVNRKGPISDAINDAAGKLAAARTKRDRDAARSEAVNSVRDAVLREAGLVRPGSPEPAGAGKGAAGGGGGGAAERGAGAAQAPADAGRGNPGAAGLRPPEPGFTGIDANGHRWVNGVQVAREEEPAAPAPTPAAPAAPAPHPAKVAAALDRYANRDKTAKGGGLFGGEDMQARQGFARLPDGAPVVFTEGEFAGRTGRIVRDTSGGTDRIVAEVDGRPGLVPVDYTTIEPLNAALSWRTEAAAAPLEQKSLLSAEHFLPRREAPPPPAPPPAPAVPGGLPRKPSGAVDALHLIAHERYSYSQAVPVAEVAHALGVPEADALRQLHAARGEGVSVSPGRDGKPTAFIDKGPGGLSRLRPEPTTATPAQRAAVKAGLEGALAGVPAGKLVPVHELRAKVPSPDKAAFDDAARALWREGKVRLVSLADLQKATVAQLDASIPGVNETFFYLEPTASAPFLPDGR